MIEINEELYKKIRNDQVDGKFPEENKYRWITPEEFITQKFYIIYGDPRGDTFIKFAENEESFTKLLNKHLIEGDTNCDFATEVYLIVKNGEEYTPTII